LTAQHLACLGEWENPFNIFDVRMFTKSTVKAGMFPVKNWTRLFLKRNKDTIKGEGIRTERSAPTVSNTIINMMHSMRSPLESNPRYKYFII